jgi:hypothetical protein
VSTRFRAEAPLLDQGGRRGLDDAAREGGRPDRHDGRSPSVGEDLGPEATPIQPGEGDARDAIRRRNEDAASEIDDLADLEQVDEVRWFWRSERHARASCP